MLTSRCWTGNGKISAPTTGITGCCSAGRTAAPHPDTITRRFKKLSAAAGLPEIDLHDVRHSYATAVEMSGVASSASFGSFGERALPRPRRGPATLTASRNAVQCP